MPTAPSTTVLTKLTTYGEHPWLAMAGRNHGVTLMPHLRSATDPFPARRPVCYSTGSRRITVAQASSAQTVQVGLHLFTSFVSHEIFPWVVAPRTLSKLVAANAAMRQAGIAREKRSYKAGPGAPEDHGRAINHVIPFLSTQRVQGCAYLKATKDFFPLSDPAEYRYDRIYKRHPR